MSTLFDVEAVYQTLKTASTYTAVFGPIPTSDHKMQRSAVRRQFAYLAQIVHPDHVQEGQEIAESAFEHLRALYNAAEEAILAGTYDKPFAAGIPPGGKPLVDFFELTSKLATYRCNNTVYRTGDFSLLYRAQAGTRELLVKIANDPTSNPLLELEASRLKKFRESDKLNSIQRFLPELVDTFMISGPDRRQYRANVMSFNPAMLSLTDIKAAFPDGLVVQQAAWIVRRVMAQTCAASMAGLVHGSITPDHVLVDPIRHEPLHIGWVHAVANTRITMIVDRWKDFYPPEIFDKKTPTHQTDLFMAAKACIFIFNGDIETNKLPAEIPKPIEQILLRCLNPIPERRPEDGLTVLTDLTTAIRTAWGRGYRPLLLPI